MKLLRLTIEFCEVEYLSGLRSVLARHDLNSLRVLISYAANPNTIFIEGNRTRGSVDDFNSDLGSGIGFELKSKVVTVI